MSAGMASFWNGSLARVLMIILAIALAILGWFQLGNINDQKADIGAVSSASTIANLDSSEAIAKCMEFRFAGIGQNVADGFVDEADTESKKAAVRSLCIAQTRGQSFN